MSEREERSGVSFKHVGATNTSGGPQVSAQSTLSLLATRQLTAAARAEMVDFQADHDTTLEDVQLVRQLNIWSLILTSFNNTIKLQTTLK